MSPPRRGPTRYLPPEDGGPDSVEDLLWLLELEELDRDLYRARNPMQQADFALYGGQVAAQAFRAAGLTVPEGRRPHSMHGYFLRPGRIDHPSILRVDRDRDGRSFSARRVVAYQDGEAIFTMSVSFHDPAGSGAAGSGVGHDHQALPFPDGLTAPEDLPELPRQGHNTMMELREFPVDAADGRHVVSRLWVRTRGPLPDDDLLHASVLVFASDMGSGFAAVTAPGVAPGGPSLDHAVWFHRPVRLDDWVLIDLQPVSVAGARGLYRGDLWDRHGLLVSSLTQEVLLRALPPA